MINFLVASLSKDHHDKLILSDTYPMNHQDTLAFIDSAEGKNVQSTRLDVENLTETVIPDNYREHVGNYVMHVMNRPNQIIAQLYLIESENFRSLRKFIVNKPKEK